MLESLKEAIKKEMTDPTSDLIDWVHTAADIVEGVDVVLSVATAAGGGGVIAVIGDWVEGVGGDVAWPVTVGVAAVAGEFAALGAGYAEAARKIKEDRSATGFAEGVVMGVFREKPEFLKSNFVEWSPEQNDAWSEGGVLAQHYYNAALVLGYHNGYELAYPDETQVFWKDLVARGGKVSSLPDTSSDERTWRDFYIDAGMQVRMKYITSD